jgi:acyl dehydratase
LLSSGDNISSSLTLGLRVEVRRSFTQKDVQCFAELSGDDNPIHVSEEYAKKGKFGRPIVHGTLLLGTFSSLIYSKIGGSGCVLVSISSTFKAPAFPDEELAVTATVTEMKRKIVKLNLQCQAVGRDKVILDGEAVILVPVEKEGPS